MRSSREGSWRLPCYVSFLLFFGESSALPNARYRPAVAWEMSSSEFDGTRQMGVVVDDCKRWGPHAPVLPIATSRIFRVMVVALPALALHVILLRISYAMRMWMIPLGACAISFATKLVMAIYLVDAHGVDALSYSTIIASYLNIMIMIVVLNRRLNRPFDSAFVLR